MGKLPETFKQYLSNSGGDIFLGQFILALALGMLLSTALKHVYIRYGKTLSDRRHFSRNFLPLTLITTFVISVVKSSLALSLGLVGALSIIRFRSAIKEPEELVYIFFAMAIGLGLGASQNMITFVVCIAIFVAVIIEKKWFKQEDPQNLLLHFSNDSSQPVKLEPIIGVLRKHCSTVDLKRFDQSTQSMEASFLIGITHPNQLTQIQEDLLQLDKSTRISFLDRSSLL